MRRSPRFKLLLVLVLALGVGLGATLLAVVDGGFRSAAPLDSPAGLALPVRSVPVRSATLAPPPPSTPSGYFGAPPGLPPERMSIAAVQRQDLHHLLGTLGGVTGLALAIVCANVALLLLGRAMARRHEMAMRRVLGAPRRRLLSQLLTEGAVVGGAGALLGLLLAIGGVKLLRGHWPAGLAPWLAGATVRWPVVLVACTPVLCALLFSLAPALGAAGDLRARIASGTRTTAGPGEGRLQRRLTVVAVASAFSLLTGALLLLRGFAAAPPDRTTALDSRDTLTLGVQSSAASPAARAVFYDSLLTRVAAIPGVRAESLSSRGAWLGLGTTDVVNVLTGSLAWPGRTPAARYLSVSPGYFRTLGIPILEGRGFTPDDREGAEAVVVVDQTFAGRVFGSNARALGHRMQLGGLSLNGTWYRIVGVASRVQPRGIGSAEPPAPTIYLPLLQVPPAAASLAVRTGDDPMAFLPAVERAVHAADPRAQTIGASTLEAELARFRSPLHWLGRLFAALAAVTTLLAALGLFGVVSLSVRQRTRELGVRMALGARESAVVRMVARQGLRLTLAGLGFGLAGAISVGRLLQFYFAGVHLSDPLPYAAAAVLLLAVSLLASHLPARAAARVDPVVSLRAE